MRVTVDGRALDLDGVRSQGIGRYAAGLLVVPAEGAAARGGDLVVLRARADGAGPFSSGRGIRGSQRVLRRPRAPARAVELLEQVLLPIDLARMRPTVHHSLALYGTPRLARVPLVVTMHDVAPLQWPELYLRTGLAHRVLYTAVRGASAIVCPSSAAREDLLRHLDLDPARVSVVPEAADERFRPTDPGPLRARLGLEGPYVLFVGGLEDPRKDVRGLVEAFARSGRSETLVLAGPGRPPDLDGARVRAAGFVPDSELPGLYTGASCFVTASRYEGFGLPLLEAAACGTPAVAYEAGAVRDTAGPGALLAPLGDSGALMRALGRVCDEPELRERLSGEARRHAERFSWRRTAELTWDVYERVAA